MEKRNISFRPNESTEKVITVIKEMGATLAEEVGRLKAKGLEADAIAWGLYLDAFDVKFQARCRALMKGTKEKPGLPEAEVIKTMTTWEPSIGGPRKDPLESILSKMDKLPEATKAALLAKIQAKLAVKK
jgi:hypothetical protein